MEPAVFRLAVSPNRSRKKIGPVRTHLYNYAFAQSLRLRGTPVKIIYRIDDTNAAKQSAEMIPTDYSFFSKRMGMQFDLGPDSENWSGPAGVMQSQRSDIYRHYLDLLRYRGFVYEDSLGRSLFDVNAYITTFGSHVFVDDIVLGRISLDLHNQFKNSDGRFLALTRSDGSVLYHLASVVDDIDFGVTHIVKGNDKIIASLYHHMIRVAIGESKFMEYLHCPMMLNDSKSSFGGLTTFDELEGIGIPFSVLRSYALSSGHGQPETHYDSLDEFVKNFSPTLVHSNNGRFDFGRLRDIEVEHIRHQTTSEYLVELSSSLERSGALFEKKLLEEDDELRALAITLKRRVSETQSIIRSIWTPEYEIPNDSLQTNARFLLGQIGLWERSVQNCEAMYDETYGLSKKEFYDAFRWILVGTHHFPDINCIFEYLKNKGMLTARIEMARNTMRKLILLSLD